MMERILDHGIVKALVRPADAGRQKAFVRELALRMGEYRPRVVLDCSRLETIDRAAAYLLLCCLEEALKRNGDMRLVGLSLAAQTGLKEAGADRLFLVFNSESEAVESFDRSIAEFASLGGKRGEKSPPPEKAA